MKSEIPKEIVFALFSGNATVLQKEIIKQWITEPNNAEIYFEWLQEWEAVNNHFSTDANFAFQKFEGKTKSMLCHQENLDNKTYKKNRLVDKISFTWKLSAAVTFIVFCSFALIFQLSKIEYKTGLRETKNIILPDGSTVILNANSMLSIQRFGFGYLSRKVYLKGEAEFKIKHTVDNQKFMVLTPDQSVVTVLGTEFTVYSRSNETSVVLNEGKVILSSAISTSPKTMKPGEKATIIKAGPIKLKKLKPTQNTATSVWQEHTMEFKNTPLLSVANQLHQTFGVNIVIDDNILKYKELTGSFTTKDPDEILFVLSEMMHFEIKMTNGIIYLK